MSHEHRELLAANLRDLESWLTRLYDGAVQYFGFTANGYERTIDDEIRATQREIDHIRYRLVVGS